MVLRDSHRVEALGSLEDNHWADRVIKEYKKIPTPTGAVTINKDELLDFLSIAEFWGLSS